MDKSEAINMMEERLRKLDKQLDEVTDDAKYDKLYLRYMNLYRIYEEAKKNENKATENSLKLRELDNNMVIESNRSKIEVIKILASIFGPLVGLLVYRAIFDKTGDPFFRDFGRNIINSVRTKL